jgi:uncharacterized protein YijF (DUF1287 family)
MIERRFLIAGAGAALLLPGCGAPAEKGSGAKGSAELPGVPAPTLAAGPRAARLIAAARRQIGVTLRYDAGYTRLAFPAGDVPRERGVCTDVVIRAYRDAFGLDLQALVNSDMRAAFAAYPKRWGLAAPDRNIDHRRVPNLATWLKRHHAALPIPSDPSGWQPGDIFTSLVSGSGTHIGLVSDRDGARSPLIIHNIGAGAREEDGLLDWPITGRFRWALA